MYMIVVGRGCRATCLCYARPSCFAALIDGQAFSQAVQINQVHALRQSKPGGRNRKQRVIGAFQTTREARDSASKTLARSLGTMHCITG